MRNSQQNYSHLQIISLNSRSSYLRVIYWGVSTCTGQPHASGGKKCFSLKKDLKLQALLLAWWKPNSHTYTFRKSKEIQLFASERNTFSYWRNSASCHAVHNGSYFCPHSQWVISIQVADIRHGFLFRLYIGSILVERLMFRDCQRAEDDCKSSPFSALGQNHP